MLTEPSHFAERMNLAERYAGQNDIANAIRIVETLAVEAPQSWRIWEKLGELKVAASRFSEAAKHFRRAVELGTPNTPSLLYKWARATFDAGYTADAKAILDDAALLASGHEMIFRLYAEIFERCSDWPNLERTARSWLTVQPQNPLPWMFAARGQWETGRFAEAMRNYRAFLDRGARNATNLATFGRLCLSALAYDEASRALDEAERLDGECGHMLSAKAILCVFRGQFQDAQTHARKAIKVDPRDAAAFKVLVQVSGAQINPDELARLRHLPLDGGLPLQDRITASFALADCFDAQGNIDAAFAAYQHANTVSVERADREGYGYDRAECKRQTDLLMSIFGAAPLAIETSARPTPIFIVGMPRSGTTLIESILGAHSGVFACGERREMRTIMQEFLSSASHLGMSGVPEATKERWREAFWRELPDLSGAVAVTDKNPWNFDALGLILDLFPAARVVHIQRDPVETGFSIFRNEFPKRASFANRLEDIGHCYGEYARLMSHWQDVMPNRFLSIRYEYLVANFDATLTELLRFCGLEWEEACRHFWTSGRVVNTISAIQARQPPNTFKGRRDRYARYLSPLVHALGEAGVDLRTGAWVQSVNVISDSSAPGTRIDASWREP